MMGYSAVTDNIDLAVQIPLYLGCVAWTVMYDTVYALQEKLQILFHIYGMSYRPKMLIYSQNVKNYVKVSCYGIVTVL